MSAVLPTYARADIAFDRGEGASLYTESGERYLDFGAGVAVTVLGHAHPHLVAALREQAGKLWHTSNLYNIPGQQRLAARLAAATFADKVFFCNSGAEALEGAIKTARKFQSHNGPPERYRIVTFEGGFHGRTLATIAAGNQEKHLAGFGPKVDGFDQVPLGDLDATRAAIGPETAAILIEPVQGEGGIRHAGWAFLRALRELADEHGLLLILDEVQTGIGRTGKLFAYEWAGIEPDIMAIAKGLGGGFPLGAFPGDGRSGGWHDGGNARLHLRRQPARHGGRQCGARCRARRGLPRLRPPKSAAAQTAAGRDHRPAWLDYRRSARRRPAGGAEMQGPGGKLIEALFARKHAQHRRGRQCRPALPPLIVSEDEIAEACEKIAAACTTLESELTAQEFA